MGAQDIQYQHKLPVAGKGQSACGNDAQQHKNGKQLFFVPFVVAQRTKERRTDGAY